jgi:hypothetical protein
MCTGIVGRKKRDQFEVDAAVIFDEATLLVECKYILDKSPMTKLERTLSLLK